jgi:hypothetical protein
MTRSRPIIDLARNQFETVRAERVDALLETPFDTLRANAFEGRINSVVLRRRRNLKS